MRRRCFPSSAASLTEPRVLYHAFVYLRWALREARPTLDESFETIAHDPHRALVREERTSALWDARAVSAASLERAVAGGSQWVPLPRAARSRGPRWRTAVAAVTGRAQVPLSIVEPIARTTRDTPENRFVRYSLDVALEIVRRVEALLVSSRETQRAGPTSACSRMPARCAAQLRRLSGSGFLADVGEMRHFPASSQVLQRRQGYREVLRHYCGLVAASRLSVLGADMTRLLETKTASTLYEYWCFFRLADELEQLLGAPLRADKSIDRGRLADVGARGHHDRLPGRRSGSPTTSPTAATWRGSYSVHSAPRHHAHGRRRAASARRQVQAAVDCPTRPSTPTPTMTRRRPSA